MKQGYEIYIIYSVAELVCIYKIPVMSTFVCQFQHQKLTLLYQMLLPENVQLWAETSLVHYLPETINLKLGIHHKMLKEEMIERFY